MYAKIFQSILDSSVANDWQVRIVFEDMLILADRFGMVDMTIEAIQRRTGLPMEIVKYGIKKLMEPDPASRNKEAEGRRLELIDDRRDWGWQIMSYEHYSKMRSAEERRDYMRQYKREQRSKATAKAVVDKAFPDGDPEAEQQ